MAALVLAPRTNLTPKKLAEPKTFTTIPVEIRLKIYQLLFVEIQLKEVSWIEEPPHVPAAHGVTRRQLKPSRPLAILAVNRMTRNEALGVAARCPIHLHIYGPLSHRGFQPPPPPVPRHQVETVVTNKPFWNFDESFPYADRTLYPNINVIKLDRMLSDAPIPAGLIMQHLTSGPREFKLPRSIFDRFNQRLDPDPNLLISIQSGRLTVKARYKFHERRLHPMMGFDMQAIIAKGVSGRTPATSSTLLTDVYRCSCGTRRA
jgi:hypothetical protein